MKDCFFQYRAGLVDKLMYSRTYEHVYGYLYNWHATQEEITASEDWRVPTATDWTNFVNHLRGTGYDDWFLPSGNELHAAFTDVDFAALGYPNVYYWSSSESALAPATEARVRTRLEGGGSGVYNHAKTATNSILPFRTFVRNNNTDYALGDVGPAGGRIGIIVDNGDGTWTYYEAAPAVIGTGTWSNITDTAVGTGVNIGDGVTNTAAIIAQAGHTASAALQCDSYSPYDIELAVMGNHLKSTRVHPDAHPRWDASAHIPLDTFGFGLLPAGSRSHVNGNFHNVGLYGYFWASTEYPSPTTDGYIRLASYNLGTFPSSSVDKENGASIRIFRNATAKERSELSNGDAGEIYEGNDNKLYQTVFINNQIWLAQNLAETQYRDGTDIPNVTVSAEWILLTDGGYCAYNNQEGYAGILIETRRTYNDQQLEVYDFPRMDTEEPYILIANMSSVSVDNSTVFSQQVTVDIMIFTSWFTDSGGGRDSDLIMNDVMELLLTKDRTPAERRNRIAMEDFDNPHTWFVSLSYEPLFDGAKKRIIKTLTISSGVDEV